MPWTEILAAQPFWATGTAIETIMGKPGLFIVGVAMFAAVLSSMNGSYLAASRVMYSMARMEALPEWFGALDEKHCTPKHGILFVAVLALVASWFGREVLGWIVDMTSVGGSIAFAVTWALAGLLLYLRVRKKYDASTKDISIINEPAPCEV